MNKAIKPSFFKPFFIFAKKVLASGWRFERLNLLQFSSLTA